MHYPTINPTIAVAVVAFLSALPTAQASLYTKSSPVLQVDAKNYERLIAKSNHTSVSYYMTCLSHQLRYSRVTYHSGCTRLSSSMHHGADTARI